MKKTIIVNEVNGPTGISLSVKVNFFIGVNIMFVAFSVNFIFWSPPLPA